MERGVGVPTSRRCTVTCITTSDLVRRTDKRRLSMHPKMKRHWGARTADQGSCEVRSAGKTRRVADLAGLPKAQIQKPECLLMARLRLRAMADRIPLSM